MESKEKIMEKCRLGGAKVNLVTLENVLNNDDVLERYVDTHERVFIYGAGAWGKTMAFILSEMGKKIAGFVVSDDVVCESTFMEFPVFHLSQLIGRENIGIIICIKNIEIVSNIVENMEKQGIKDYITLASLSARKNGETKKSERVNGDIKFSILMPVYNVEVKYLQEAIQSIKDQLYLNWELCLVDDASTDFGVREYLKSINCENIKVMFLEDNKGISGATNEAANIAEGDYLILMDNDDLITPDALLEFYKEIEKSGADIIYSDQDIVDNENKHSQPLYKPDWSPDLLLSQMYIGHLLGFRKKLFDKVGGFRKEYNGSQDYDLMLRMSMETDKIAHVQKILYSWRSLPSSTATNAEAKPYAQIAGQKAVQCYLDSKLGKGKAVANETDNYFVYDVKYLLEREVLISIVIPTKDHWEDLKKAIDSIYEKSTYRNFEIIILNNNSEQKETYEYFDKVQKQYKEVKVIEAFYEFNWSKLCNHGIAESSGEVLVMLNNDVEICSEDWLERLASNALREEIGMVGGLLLYADGTIQHAGVLAGFGGWADHIFKGMKPVHYGSPFISPMVTRNVTAVTGACMAFSRKTYEKIGGFDEEYIICGSDIELCIRAIEHGLRNVYIPQIRLMHYESKSRIGLETPEIDFKLGFDLYAPFRENGDPYYNNNLDYNSYVPKLKNEEIKEELIEVGIGEIKEIKFRKQNNKRKRINILVPSICEADVFGGIATALRFFEKLVDRQECDSRIILVDREPDAKAREKYGTKYKFVSWEEDSEAQHQIVSFFESTGKTLSVRDNDIFMVTAWWTAHYIQEEYQCWSESELVKQPIIYFIQDYEPGFYPWSTQYLLADATYRSALQHIAIFNSSLLADYFEKNDYHFYKTFYFEPKLNGKLRDYLSKCGNKVKKKKQILVYGRPGTPRNAFTLMVEALKKWVEYQENVEEWSIVSAGEAHSSVNLGHGAVLRSVGKLSIEEYAKVLSESYAGISLMVSPHPSYPPLEMAAFGVRVITNTYANKDLEDFSDNVTSVREATPSTIGKCLYDICQEYQEDKQIDMESLGDYCKEQEEFDFIEELVSYL